jgi:hypothetical protein
MVENNRLEQYAQMEAVENVNQSMPDFVNSAEIGRRFLEPETQVTSIQFNRNLQMGNIKREDLVVASHKFNVAQLINEVPDANGRFLFQFIADHLIKDVNFLLVASNSVEGKGRNSVVSRIVRSFSKDETPQGGFGSLVRKKE